AHCDFCADSAVVFGSDHGGVTIRRSSLGYTPITNDSSCAIRFISSLQAVAGIGNRYLSIVDFTTSRLLHRHELPRVGGLSLDAASNAGIIAYVSGFAVGENVLEAYDCHNGRVLASIPSRTLAESIDAQRDAMSIYRSVWHNVAVSSSGRFVAATFGDGTVVV